MTFPFTSASGRGMYSLKGCTVAAKIKFHNVPTKSPASQRLYSNVV